MAEGDVVVERFDKAHHDRNPFDSIDSRYSRYLKEVANQHGRKSVNVLYVAVREDDAPPKRVFGYFTASMGAIKNDDVDDEIREEFGLPRIQIPTLHTGMMAVDKIAEGKGLGSLLITEAGKPALGLSSQVGCWGLSLDMDKDHIGELRPWYQKRRFSLLRRGGLMMVLPLSTLAKALGKQP